MSRLAKVLIALAACLLLVVAAIVGGGYWVVRSATAAPEFYTAVRVPEDAEDRRQLVAETREQTLALFEPVAEVADESPPREATQGGEATDPSRRDAITIRLSEAALNALLIEEVPLPPSLQAPRVQLLDGRLRLGVLLQTKQLQGVVSLDLTPTLVSDQTGRLTLDDARLGRLPLPAAEVIRRAEVDVADLPDGLRLDRSRGQPAIELDWGLVQPGLKILELRITADAVELVAVRQAVEADRKTTRDSMRDPVGKLEPVEPGFPDPGSPKSGQTQ